MVPSVQCGIQMAAGANTPTFCGLHPSTQGPQVSRRNSLGHLGRPRSPLTFLPLLFGSYSPLLSFATHSPNPFSLDPHPRLHCPRDGSRSGSTPEPLRGAVKNQSGTDLKADQPQGLAETQPPPPTDGWVTFLMPKKTTQIITEPFTWEPRGRSPNPKKAYSGKKWSISIQRTGNCKPTPPIIPWISLRYEL